jgi:hypothetical protein
MPPDNARHLVAAAKQRQELTRAKAIRAIRELHRTGSMVTFGTVAREAAISRSWLYTQPDIRDEIQKLRAATQPRAGKVTAPSAQRASADSARRRLATMQTRIHNLVEENQRLRAQLAVALGEQRIRAVPDGGRASITI